MMVYFAPTFPIVMCPQLPRSETHQRGDDRAGEVCRRRGKPLTPSSIKVNDTLVSRAPPPHMWSRYTSPPRFPELHPEPDNRARNDKLKSAARCRVAPHHTLSRERLCWDVSAQSTEKSPNCSHTVMLNNPGFDYTRFVHIYRFVDIDVVNFVDSCYCALFFFIRSGKLCCNTSTGNKSTTSKKNPTQKHFIFHFWVYSVKKKKKHC